MLEAGRTESRRELNLSIISFVGLVRNFSSVFNSVERHQMAYLNFNLIISLDSVNLMEQRAMERACMCETSKMCENLAG